MLIIVDGVGFVQVAPAGTVVHAHGGIPDYLKCAVCLDALKEPVMLKGGVCSHCYCRKCLLPHLRRARTCPECRGTAVETGRCVGSRSEYFADVQVGRVNTVV
jgi:hypothetical protein